MTEEKPMRDLILSFRLTIPDTITNEEIDPYMKGLASLIGSYLDTSVDHILKQRKPNLLVLKGEKH